MTQRDAIFGAMLGCAVGDALGLPYEALSRRRASRLLGAPDRHRFVFGRGMVSDDTEHTCLVAQSLCEAPVDADAFGHVLGRRMRWWLLRIPAGIGGATLRATCKLWLGFPASRSGVFSAGNGPAMRSPPLGATIDDLAKLREFVRVGTLITHTDPRAFEGAFAVAVAAWCAKRGVLEPERFDRQVRDALGAALSEEFESLLVRVGTSVSAGESTEQFASGLGCDRGVSGYVFHTVSVALHACLRHPRDFREAVMSAIRCGGDTDTVAAIVGAIVGTAVGEAGIPAVWRDRLAEWPASVAWMRRLADAAATATTALTPVSPPRVAAVAVLARNLGFLAVVLTHVIRRVLPPY